LTSLYYRWRRNRACTLKELTIKLNIEKGFFTEEFQYNYLNYYAPLILH
jgi:hypothetical protein